MYLITILFFATISRFFRVYSVCGGSSSNDTDENNNNNNSNTNKNVNDDNNSVITIMIC